MSQSSWRGSQGHPPGTVFLSFPSRPVPAPLLVSEACGWPLKARQRDPRAGGAGMGLHVAAGELGKLPGPARAPQRVLLHKRLSNSCPRGGQPGLLCWWRRCPGCWGRGRGEFGAEVARANAASQVGPTSQTRGRVWGGKCHLFSGQRLPLGVNGAGVAHGLFPAWKALEPAWERPCCCSFQAVWGSVFRPHCVCLSVLCGSAHGLPVLRPDSGVR